MRIEVYRYYESIDCSLRTAQSGWEFAADARTLCNSIMRPTNDVRRYIQELRAMAQRSLDEAKAVRDRLRINRQNFFSVSVHLADCFALIE
jgi:hypothetical protein